MTLEEYLRRQPGPHYHAYTVEVGHGLTLVLVPYYEEIARRQAFAVEGDTVTPLTEPKEKT